MTTPSRLDESLKRLMAALDQLDAASERRAMADRVRADLEEELSLMQDDRARLAAELDGTLSRSRALALANEDVRQRLERTADAIRGVLSRLRPEDARRDAQDGGREGGRDDAPEETS